jgi:hypothetical protein
LKVKSRIDANLMPGPSIDVTAPYLEGAPTPFSQMHELTGPDDAKGMVTTGDLAGKPCKAIRLQNS